MVGVENKIAEIALDSLRTKDLALNIPPEFTS